MDLRASLVVLAAAGCADPPPPDTYCSLPVRVLLATPNIVADQVPRIAVGGSMTAYARCASPGSMPSSLDLPYEISDGGGRAVSATKVEGGIELVGVAEGSNTLRIYSEYFDDRFAVSASTVTKIELVPGELRNAAAGGWVWAPGHHYFSLAISDDAGPVVDQSATVTFTNGAATTSFTVDVDTPGTYSVTARAGTLTTELPYTVSTTADTITADNLSKPIEHQSTSFVCFSAFDQARRMLGLDWTFTVDGVDVPSSVDCAEVAPSLDRPIGSTAVITAAAGGQSLTVSIPVI